MITNQLLYQLSYTGENWSGQSGSNRRQEIGNLACYPYTMPAQMSVFPDGQAVFRLPDALVGWLQPSVNFIYNLFT